MKSPLSPAPISPVQDIVDEMRAGRMVILVDEEDRENEGDVVLAADAAADNDVALAKLSPAALDALNGALPPTWSHANPVDIIGDASADRFAAAMKTLLDDVANDGVLLLFCPTIALGAEETAHALLPLGTLEQDALRWQVRASDPLRRAADYAPLVVRWRWRLIDW